MPFRRSGAPTACLAIVVWCTGCASVPNGEPAGGPIGPAPVERVGALVDGLGERAGALGERVESTIDAERRRVDDFPDLPDASGDPARPGVTDADGEPLGDDVLDDPDRGSPGVVTDRVRQERRAAFNPYVLTAHRQNFFLPFYGTTDLNEDVYRDSGSGYDNDLQPVELRFQVSLKAQLNGKDLLLADDSLSFGLTLEAWWQVYNSELSRPFRETNYTPELFYTKPLLWGPFGGATSFTLGIAHQSNGQGGSLSRSWNRIYTGLTYENGGFVARLRPWYRIPEDPKETPDDPRGDDNPDIEDFLGHGDLSLYLRRGTHEYASLMRLNPSTGKGAVRLGYTFPLTPRFRGLVEYFVGYGDSLIDYDHFQQRLGVGIALTDLL